MGGNIAQKQRLCYNVSAKNVNQIDNGKQGLHSVTKKGVLKYADI